jgi:hypothetical protein
MRHAGDEAVQFPRVGILLVEDVVGRPEAGRGAEAGHVLPAR